MKRENNSSFEFKNVSKKPKNEEIDDKVGTTNPLDDDSSIVYNLSEAIEFDPRIIV